MSVSSNVRITHIPSGIVVECNQQRSQYKNRQHALKILRGKLYILNLENKVRDGKMHSYEIPKDTPHPEELLDCRVEEI